MKKIESNDVLESMEGVLLFRDDLEEIMERMRLRSLAPRISDPETVYDSLDEVQQLKGNRPPKLSLYAHLEEPYTTIKVNAEKDRVWISAHGSAEFRSFAFELKDFVTKKVLWRHRFLSPWVWGGIAFCFLAAAQGVGHYPTPLIIMISGSILSWFLAGFAFIDSRISYGVRLTRRHQGGFFTRNRDQILLLLFGTAIGVIVTLLVQWLPRK